MLIKIQNIKPVFHGVENKQMLATSIFLFPQFFLKDFVIGIKSHQHVFKNSADPSIRFNFHI